MGAAHGHELYFHAHSPVHRLAAHVKLLLLVTFVLVVVATPRTWVTAFALYGAVLAAVALASRIPPGYLARRMVVEIPFVVFAALLPFISGGPRTQLLGMTLSGPGVLAAWGLLVKGSLGVLAGVLFAATTDPRDLLVGLQRLRVPGQIVLVMGFMVRYLEVVAAELRRMQVAREARGFQGRGPAGWRVVARSGGALFIRSYERGERVHLAMLSRGFGGRMPDLAPRRHEGDVP